MCGKLGCSSVCAGWTRVGIFQRGYARAMTVIYITEFCSYAVLSGRKRDHHAGPTQVVCVVPESHEYEWEPIREFPPGHLDAAGSYADELERKLK
jgi:hypothetical protein